MLDPQLEKSSGIRLEANVAALSRPCFGAAEVQEGSSMMTVISSPSFELPTRRDFLYVATASTAAAGLAAASVPFIAQMNPDASTIAAAAPIDVDVSLIVEGQIIKVFWRGKPIFISHRTREEIEEAGAVDWRNLIDPAPDAKRVKEGHEQWLVVIGICTHLGCIPLAHQGDYHGWFCPCHGSQYDTAGRVRRGPAPANLYLPPYEFLAGGRIRIG